MKPIAVIQMHDPTGVMFPHLEAITPVLKQVFAQVFVSVTAITQRRLPDSVARLEENDFFQVSRYKFDITVGEDFLTLYAKTASACHPDQILHLCFIDRVAYALQSNYQADFIRDVKAVKGEQTPLIFARSESAWQTHPGNYRAVERMATNAGELLFGKPLDFAWCHLVVRARRLQEVIPTIERRDLSFFAEFTLALRNEIHMKEVDWLSWEDPFILSRDPDQLKGEREGSIVETRKRLAYAIPILKLLASVDDESLFADSVSEERAARRGEW